MSSLAVMRTDPCAGRPHSANRCVALSYPAPLRSLWAMRGSRPGMLMRGPVRLKRPLNASGKGQTVATRLAEAETALEKVTTDELATYGIVLEESLRDV